MTRARQLQAAIDFLLHLPRVATRSLLAQDATSSTISYADLVALARTHGYVFDVADLPEAFRILMRARRCAAQRLEPRSGAP
jgi:hypothetical protein